MTWRFLDKNCQILFSLDQDNPAFGFLHWNSQKLTLLWLRWPKGIPSARLTLPNSMPLAQLEVGGDGIPLRAAHPQVHLLWKSPPFRDLWMGDLLECYPYSWINRNPRIRPVFPNLNTGSNDIYMSIESGRRSIRPLPFKWKPHLREKFKILQGDFFLEFIAVTWAPTLNASLLILLDPRPLL